MASDAAAPTPRTTRAPPPAPLKREQWARLLPLLGQALDLDSGEPRERWLATLPPGDAQGLRALLSEHAAIETSDFLQHAAPLLPAATDVAEPWRPGAVVGPWRLLQRLGRGGMAVVWSAERADGRHARRVALKLPTLGGTPALAPRLAREGRILAQLAHPAIAQVLDAGVDGLQPWLALELVQGQPITEYARERGLSIPQRLRLFVAVLRAVAHAHAQLVVHRDIKPANVFVTHEGQVKLLDFGVAKLLEHADALSAETALTREAGRALTPQYASPEQIAGAPLSTRSDVYSLGVLLYELLTGMLPYSLRRGSAAELEEAVLTAAIRRPSAAAGDKDTARGLRGDIDTIAMKALAHEPGGRYASADAFADDIERHLAQQPILARAPSWGYRAAKLWARQRLALLAGALATLALVAALGWALRERERSRAEARRAEAVQAFLATTLGTHDPEVAQGRSLSARDLLDRGAARIDTDFAATPDVQVRLHDQVAQLYSRMGEMAASLRHADAAIRLYESQGEAGSTAYLELLFVRHEALIDLARWDEARAAIDQALAMAERHAGAGNRWAPRLVGGRSWVALQQGRWPDAVADAERATALQVALTGEASPDALHALNNEAITAQQTGRIARAVALQRRISELGPRTPGHTTTDLLVERSNLYGALLVLGDSAAALQGLRSAWPALRQHLGPTHDRVLSQSLTLAQALAEQAQFGAAERLLRENLALAESRGELAHEHPTLLRAALARVLTLAGRAAEALPLAQSASDEFDRRYAEPTWARERARWFLAEALIGSGHRAAGVARMKAVRQNLERLVPSRTHPAHAQAALVQAVAQRIDDPTGAQALAAEACQRLQEAGEDGVLRLPRCRAIEAWLAGQPPEGRGVPARQLAAFRAARDAAIVSLPSGHPLRAQFELVETELLGRPGAAASLLLLN